MIRIALFSEVNSKFGSPFLRRLMEHPYVKLVGLITSPPGRLCPYYIDEPNPVDLEQEAVARSIPVFRPEKVNSPDLNLHLRKVEPDYFLIANYQQIFKSALLDVPRWATINFHPSPLPRYAGWAPFFWMAKYGERSGGVSAILVNTQIDGGPILAQRPVEMTGAETALEIRNRHFRESLPLLEDVLQRLIQYQLAATPQELSLRSYFGKPGEQEYRIDFREPTETILRTIRAGYRFPGAYALTEEGEKCIILSAERAEKRGQAYPGVVSIEASGTLVATGDSWLRILTVSQGAREIPISLLETPISFRSFLPAQTST